MIYEGYGSPITNNETFNQHQDRYLYLSGQKKYTPKDRTEPAIQYSPKTSSIENILEQDSQSIQDKLIHTAFSIVYRIRIYNDITGQLDYNWLKTKSGLTQLDDWLPGLNQNVERRKSMLTKELHALDKQRLEEKVNCWKDLSEPSGYFLDLMHQHKELKQDKAILE